jgi:hypothetical protein
MKSKSGILGGGVSVSVTHLAIRLSNVVQWPRAKGAIERGPTGLCVESKKVKNRCARSVRKSGPGFGVN